MITFFVKGIPMPWQRVGRGKYGAYVPRKTKVWKTRIAWESKLYRPDKPFTGPLCLMLIFQFKRPKSIKKGIYAIGRSDVDNYCKSVMDALHDQFYNNDNQVVSLSAVKIYGDPGVHISVVEMDKLPQKGDFMKVNNILP